MEVKKHKKTMYEVSENGDEAYENGCQIDKSLIDFQDKREKTCYGGKERGSG